MKRYCVFITFVLIHLVNSEVVEPEFSAELKHFVENIHGFTDIGRQPFGTLRPLVSDLEDDVLGHPEVDTSIGKIIGTSHLESHSFYSIPYGQAPIGDLRFKPPQPVAHQGVVNASVPDYVTCHEFLLRSENNDSTFDSEDCLLVNVDVPATVDLLSPPSELLPVMVWLHGGAFFFGGGTRPEYEARWLSNVTSAIIVTVNYRLDALGFLVYDEGEESFDGNQGIKDQQLALKWVYENIEHFGGDKNMITLFGQSAGAQSTTYHLMSHISKPYFKRAILQSYPAAYYYYTKEQAKMKTEALLSTLDCGEMTPMDCLRTIPPEELISAHVRVSTSDPFDFFNVIEPYRPVLDDEFPDQPLDYFRSGLWQNEKEVIIGTTSDEGAYVSGALEDFTMGRTLYETFTRFIVGSEYAAAVIEKYDEVAGFPDDPDYDFSDIVSQIIGDMLFVCPSRILARFMSATSTAKPDYPAVYLYLDSHPLEGPTCENYTNFCGYAFHAADIPLVFNNGPSTGYEYSKEDILVKDMFHEFWKNFAYTGKPTENITLWPYYTENRITNPDIAPWTNFQFQAPQGDLQTEFKKDLCDFWDELGIYVNMSFPVEVTTTSMEVTATSMEVTTTSMEVTTTSMEMTTSGTVSPAPLKILVPLLTFVTSYLVRYKLVV